MRQIANQARQLATDAADVRRQLSQAGVQPKDLAPVDDVVKALQALGNEKSPQNPKGLQELYQTAVDRFKVLEFEIRKRVDTSNDQMFLSGSEDMPPQFKALIEEYSRALAKKKGGG
jgi:flagellar motor protein MotB